MEKDNNRAYLQRQLEQLKQQHIVLMRGRMVPSSRAQIVQRKILNIQHRIEAIDKEAASRFNLAKMPIDEALEVIALPLMADVINDMVAGVDANLRRHGVQETVFATYTAQIRKAALAMVDTLSATEENMPMLLDVDDTLVDAVKKKMMSFIRQRLKIKKK